MEELQIVRKTDLARQTRKVIRDAQRGLTVVVESHGQPEVAIIDIVDYYILRAVMRYHAAPVDLLAGSEPGSGLADEALAELQPQALYDLVLGFYLAGAISLGRAAELLELPWLDLRTRFTRLDVPLRQGPADLDEAQAEVESAASWLEDDQDS